MKTLQAIDFVGRKPLPPAGLACLALAGAGLLWQAYQTFTERQLQERERVGMAALFRPAKAVAVAMTPEDRRRHAQIDKLTGYIATPWDRWLTVFEDHGKDKAIVQHLELDAATDEVKLTARAASTEGMMQYVIALQSDPRLREVRLLNQEWLRTEPGAPIQFELTAQSKVGRGAP